MAMQHQSYRVCVVVRLGYRLYDCSVSANGSSVSFSGSSPLKPCGAGHVHGLSFEEMAAADLLGAFEPWAPCADNHAACSDLAWKVACVPVERRAELAPGVTYLDVRNF